MKLMRRNSDDMMPNLFDTLFNNNWYGNTNVSNRIPAVNIRENDEAFELDMAAPGMKKSDFNIKLENDVLTIAYEKKQEQNDKRDTYSRYEFGYNSFERSFVLPETVDTEKISASYKDGILKLVLTKKEEAKDKAPRTIKIG